MSISRREFIIKTALGLGFVGINIPMLAGRALAAINPALNAPDANGIMLPQGFTSRIVARSGERAAASDYRWHGAPDGGAVFPAPDGGWIYVSNSEVRSTGKGGVGALRFSAGGEIVDSYPILQNTMSNCAGGATPWNTWLSCEEHSRGRVWETDPFGKREARVHDALGVFSHEAAAVDEKSGIVYLTEDSSTEVNDISVKDGLFYRFLPAQKGDLSAGILEAAAVDAGGHVSWLKIPDPVYSGDAAIRHQLSAATQFKGGEGIVMRGGEVYFSTKGDNVIWHFNPATQKLVRFYDFEKSSNPILKGVDNLAVTPSDDIIVAEDGGDMELVGLDATGAPYPLLRVIGQDESEITGPAFNPTGDRLYFSSQRGAGGDDGDGITYEISGPFRLWKG